MADNQIEIIITVNDRAAAPINTVSNALNNLSTTGTAASAKLAAAMEKAAARSTVLAAQTSAATQKAADVVAASAARKGAEVQRADNLIASSNARAAAAAQSAANAVAASSARTASAAASAAAATTAAQARAAAATATSAAAQTAAQARAAAATATSTAAQTAAQARLSTVAQTSANSVAASAARAAAAQQTAANTIASSNARAAAAIARANQTMQSGSTHARAMGQNMGFLGGQLNKITSLFEGVIIGMVAFQATRLPAAIISTAVQAYASYERLGLTLKNLLAVELTQKDASLLMRDAMGQVTERSQELIKWTEELAILSPFTQETVTYTLQTAMGYGMTSDMAQKLTQALADYAAGTGRSEEQTKLLGLALGQVWSKGKLTGEEMRQLTNAGMGVEFMATAAGMSLSDFTDVMKEGELDARKLIPRLIELSDERFAGAAKAQATSWAGLLSTLDDITKIGLRTFFADTLKDIQPMLSGFLDAWPKFKRDLGDAGRSFAEFGSNAVKILGDIKSKWTDMGEEGQHQIIVIATLIAAPGALGLAIRSAQAAIGALGFAFTGLLGKVTLVIGAVIGLSTALRKAAEPTLTWGEALEKTWGPALQVLGEASKRAGLELQKMMDPQSSAAMQIALQETTEAIEKQRIKVTDLNTVIIEAGQDGVAAFNRYGAQYLSGTERMGTASELIARLRSQLNAEYEKEKTKLKELELGAKNIAIALKEDTDGAFNFQRALANLAATGVPGLEALQKAFSRKKIDMPDMAELAKAWIQVNGEAELMFTSTSALIRNYEQLNNVSIRLAASQGDVGAETRNTYGPMVATAGATESAAKAAEDAAAAYARMVEQMRNIIASSAEVIDYLVSIDPAALAAAAAVDTLRLRLVGLKDQQAGLQESIKASQAVLAGLQNQVSRLGDALSAAKQRLADLAAPRLKGMGELDNQISAVERQLKRLKMVDTMVPSLQEIKDQFKDLARVTTQGGVTMTQFGLTDEEAQAKLSDLRKQAMEDVKKQFPEMTKEMQDYLDTLPNTAEGLQKILEKLELTKDLKFDEALKKLADAANGVTEELTFEDALAQIEATKNEISGLEGQLSAAKLAAEAQTAAIAAMQAASEEMTKAIQQMERDLETQEKRQKLVNDALEIAYKWFTDDRLKMIAMGDTAAEQTAIIDDKTRDLLTLTTTYAQGEAAAAVAAIQAAVDEYKKARALMAAGLGVEGGGVAAAYAEWQRQRVANGEEPNDQEAWAEHRRAIGLASGTRSWRGGLVMVGEQGPELVNLPRGSQVYPTSVTNQMLGGPTYVLNLRTEQSSMGIIQDWAYLKAMAGA
ncbi:MAG: tape measure protein [Chloroflexi bacterium]|nr:tape measure protein [Chloroflexota bacterium]